MKFVSAIFKILAALAFVAGAIYLLATYGDKIVAWCKKILACECCCVPAKEADTTAEVVAEEVPVAEDNDFVG